MGAAASSNVKKNGLELGFGLLAKAGVKFVHVFGAIIVFLVLWEIAPDLGLINEVIIPTPTTIFDKFVQTILSGELLTHVGISMQRILLGFGIALAVALPLGFLLGGWFKTLETAVNPLLHMFSQANPFTLLPAFIAVLGLGELSKVTMILWVSMWPVLFGTVSGIRNVDPELVKMARSFGLSRGQLFERVLLPGALPSVFAGIRSATLLAFFFLIGAEMIGASSGLGYMISQACPFHQGSFQLEKMWAGIVTVALLGILLNGAVARIERRFSRWREGAEI
jgi:NitT/TauT family transport system permease protein